MFIFYDFRSFCIDNARVIGRKIRYIFVDPLVPFTLFKNHIFSYSIVCCHIRINNSKYTLTIFLTILSLLNNWESFWFNCFCKEAICSLSWVIATTWSDEFGSCGSPRLLPAPPPPRDTLAGGPPSPSFSPLGWFNFVTSTRCGRLLWPLCLQNPCFYGVTQITNNLNSKWNSKSLLSFYRHPVPI